MDGLVLCLDAANTRSYPGSGTTWADLSGNGNSGTLTNGPTYSSANGGFLSFDGTNDYVDLGQSNKFASTNLTLDVWLNLPSGTNQGVRPISNQNGGGFENGDFNLRIDGSGTYERKPCLEIGTGASQGTQFFSDTLINYDVWYKETIDTIKANTDRPIIERVKGSRGERNEYSIYDALDEGVFATVAFNSIAAMESIAYGVPAFVRVPCAAYPLASKDLTNIEKPYYPDEDLIQQHCRSLAYGQFLENELRDGTAWRILNNETYCKR